MKETKTAILSGIEGITSSKFIAPNTIAYIKDNQRFIRLHQTDILVFADDSIRISSGGWKTVTTKDRINRFLPKTYRLISENGFWVITHNGKNFPFKDNMVIDSGVSDSGDYKKMKETFTKNARKVTKFIDDYAKLLRSGKMELPSSGDCFICQIAAQNSEYKNYEHIQSHIEENYLVPSLIHAACIATKNNYYLSYIVDLQRGNIPPLSTRDIKRILRSYFKKQES